MKKLSILALAAVGLFGGACSSDKDVVQDGNILEDKGVGYFKVSLNLPSTPSTRAAWNETEELQSGALISEWAVDNAILVLFAGTDEATAKVVQVSSLVNAFADVTPNNPDQVTQKNEEVVTLSAGALTSDNLYALAIINGTGVVEASGSDLKINGTVKADATLADLQSEITKLTAYGDANPFVNASKHIFMTNAVLSNVKGGSSDPTASPALHILVPVNKSLIADTKAAAEAGAPAADIYVERGVAKVTLDDASTYVTSTITAKGSATVEPGFMGWCLDNINSRSYILRKVPAVAAGTFAWNYMNTKAPSAEKYRFIGNYPVDAEYSTSTAGYRTYWALDPNYDAAAGTDLLTPAPADFETALDANKEKVGDDNPIYCFENTFDVDRQSYKNTTSAVIKVAFNGGKDFYTVGADRKTIYPESEVGTLIANALLGISDFGTWYTAQPRVDATLSGNDLEVTWSATGPGIVKVTGISIKASKFTDATARDLTSATGWSTWKTTIESQVSNIKRFKNGMAYYPIRIKHFGDDLTPWNSGELATDPAESTIDKIYPGTGDERNNAYLGRYGVVRNNWYVLHIDGITKLGYTSPTEIHTPDSSDPTTPDPDHPDDDLDDNFIKARINILSWAKRPQNWNLK